MTCVVVVGAQWGDEGKGKVVDLCTERASLVARYAGGPNAGHTLVVGGEKTIVRLIPSGVLRPDSRCVLGQGMVIDPAVLVDEIDGLTRRGVERVQERLLLSERAHLILPYHVLVDGLREARASAIGTTKKGIGPAYEDKARRLGVRAADLRHPKRLRDLVSTAIAAWTPVLLALGGEVPSVEAILETLAPLGDRLTPLLGDASRAVHDAIQAGEPVLLEGAQGTLLDIDHGTYPFVTSSSAVAGGAATGLGIGPTRIDHVLGIAKAYLTRVGGGPFPTELSDATGEHLRTVGHEFGSVTGRPRRTGWLDLPALRYAARVNGLDSLALTKLDVLSGLSEVALCVGYELNGARTKELPVDELDSAKPVLERFAGWQEPLEHARSISELPRAARAYLDRVAEFVDVPITVIGVGPGREASIVLADPFA
ncbi:MAG: adenylosuccinate synthase [Polyangiaceae bacterium]|nr:adenylosuccinate synthase [Polyangiaceae bacterium]